MSDTNDTNDANDAKPVEPQESAEETQSTGGDAPATVTQDTLLDRLDKVHAELSKRGRRMRVGNIVFTVVGALLVLLLFGYFTFGYAQIRYLAQSESLFALLESSISTMTIPGTTRQVPTTLTQTRAVAESEIEKNSVKLAAQLSEQALTRGPALRQSLEDFAIGQMESVLDRGSQMTENKFRTIIADNRQLIQDCLRDLEENDEVAQQRIDQLAAAMEQELQTDLESQAEDVLDALNFANRRLTRLADGKDLTHEETLERQIVMILRRMALEQADPSLKGKAIEVPVAHTSAAVPEGQTKAAGEDSASSKSGDEESPK